MSYDETVLSAQAVTIQAALLYTSSDGERRIRVHTMVLPVSVGLIVDFHIQILGFIKIL
jgi:protein transport protein SEC24